MSSTEVRSGVERRRIDAACIFDPEGSSGGRRAQDLSFELVVANARVRGLEVVPVGYPEAGRGGIDLSTAFDGYDPACVYWHVPGRNSWEDFTRAVSEGPRSLRDVPLLVGGDFASRYAHEVLDAEPCVDAVVRGEPEETLAATATSIRRASQWRTEPGLTVRTDRGIVRNPARQPITDLDGLTRRLPDFVDPQRDGTERTVLLSRGCEGDCQYCGLQNLYRNEATAGAPSWRPRTSESVLDEIETLHSMGVDRFHFNSSVFFGVDGRGAKLVRGVAEGIIARELEVELRFISLVRDLHRNLELLPVLREAGLNLVTVGVDSGLSRALDMYRVESSEGMVHESLAALAELEIPFFTSFIFYDPYLSLREIRQNLRFVLALKPYYRHMRLPFSYFLDQQFLGTALQVRWSTPLYGRLVEDGLAECVDSFERDPRIGFQDLAVGRLFQAHQAVNKLFMPSLRPFLFSKDVTRVYPVLEDLPAEIVERLAERFEERPDLPPREAVVEVAGWLVDLVTPRWGEMIALLDLNEEQRGRMEEFYVRLTKAATPSGGGRPSGHPSHPGRKERDR